MKPVFLAVLLLAAPIALVGQTCPQVDPLAGYPVSATSEQVTVERAVHRTHLELPTDSANDGTDIRQVTREDGAMAKVTGVGGVFFKTRSDRAALAAWYQRHLGLELESWGGAVLRWPGDALPDGGLTVWHVADADSKWFSPSDAAFMINYRVDDLDELLTQLRAGGVEIVSGPESHENGKFAWILDLDGNKVELWQPMAWDEKNKEVDATA